MQDQQKVGRRIKDLRMQQGLSESEVARKLEITPAEYSRIEISNTSLVVKNILILSELFHVSTDYLLQGRQPLSISVKNGFIPFVPVKAHAGFINAGKKDISTEDYEVYRVPGYNPTSEHLLFEIEGEGMAPTLFPGDVVICQKKNVNQIPDGSPVLVITENRILAKRIVKDVNPETVILANDNPQDNLSIKFEISSIKEIMIIRGKISEVRVSNHEVLSKGRLNHIQETIDLLEREFQVISRKLKRASYAFLK